MSRFKSGIASLVMVLAMASQAFAATPTISSILPTSGPAGAGAFTTYVNGANFTTRSTVNFANCAGVMWTYKSSTQMTATIPSTCMAAAGTVGVQVADPTSGLSNVMPFQIYQGTGGFAILTTSIPGGTTGTPYNATLQASGGTAPYSWALSGGGLPAGLTMSSAGMISGTPTASGSYTFGVALRDSAGHSAGDTYSTSIATATTTALASGSTSSGSSTTSTALAISTTSVPSGTAGTAYGATQTASGGISPYSWAIASGTLPPGLTLSPGGAISGTPTTSGSYSFTAQVKDSASNSATQTYSTSVIAPTSSATGPTGATGPTPLTIAQIPPMSGTAGTAFIANLVATGGTSQYSWTVVSGAPPPGLSLSSGGALSGTPAASGTYSFTAQVTDSASQSANYQYTCAIN